MRNLFVLIIALLFAACSDSGDRLSQDACSVLGEAQGNARIVDGTLCRVEGAAIVQITLLFEDGGIGSCSGTMVTSSKVLTAAHCFEPPDDSVVEDYSVRVEGVDFSVHSVVTHPNANIPQNDVAIVTLTETTSAPTFPLILSRPSNTGDIISIFGYGVDENGNFGALRSGEMEITGVTSQDIFARFTGKEGSNVCFGDSGGPALYTLKDGGTGIVGVTSFGTTAGCVEDGFAGFANVQGNSISEFILKHAPDIGVI